MTTRSRFIPLILLVAIFSTATILDASAGAGGLIFGIQRPDLSPSFLPPSGASAGVESIGGFGYALDAEGFIVGGFGMALLDQGILDGGTMAEGSYAGGVGGLLVGQRLIGERRFKLDLSARLGVGGLAQYQGDWTGWAVVFAEPYAEATIVLSPWMALSAQLGYRLMGNFAPGLAFDRFFLLSPVLCFAVSWGSFR